ncbi:MAG: hypothetical protein WC839_02025 [Candidatus Paceibacterota bacterium]
MGYKWGQDTNTNDKWQMGSGAFGQMGSGAFVLRGYNDIIILCQE